MLPSDAPMPPCAATVCERVGNTLDSTATFRPARDSCREARMPEPPAPTMTTSNLRVAMLLLVYAIVLSLDAPERLDGPAGAAEQPHDDQELQHEADAHGLHVVHQHVPHADPHVVGQAEEGRESQHLHPLRMEDPSPPVVTQRAAREQ